MDAGRVLGVSARSSKFRAEIQGFRALSIAQVLLFHAWHVGSPIGVDVFIMISAYLLTGSLVRRAEAGSIQPFWQRWVHIFKRLLPPLVVTVVVTLGATMLFLPKTRWLGVLEQSWASLFYYQNWLLQSEAVDYFAADSALQSPLMHLWSMSMQGQIFLLFPLLVWVVARLAKRFDVSVRKLALAVFGLLALGSFVWLLAKFVDGANLSFYFDTRSRIWEFAIGSLVAIVEPWIRVSNRISTVLGWLGVGVVVLFGLVSIGSYPGPAALAPMMGAAFMLLFARVDTSGLSVARLLSWRPLVYVGDNSYALYLVHWPIFVMVLVALRAELLPILVGIGLSAASFLLAIIVTRLVDDPVRTSPWINASSWRKLGVVSVSLAVGSALVFGLGTWMNRILAVGAQPVEAEVPAGEVEPYLGAQALDIPGGDATINTEREGITPIPEVGSEGGRWTTLPHECTGVFSNPPSLDDDPVHWNHCKQLTETNADGLTVVFWGNSHMMQYGTAIKDLALEENWNVGALSIGSCHIATDDTTDKECIDWYDQSIHWLTEEVKPDVVVFVVTAGSSERPDQITGGAEQFIQTLNDAGISVVGLRDNPRFKDDQYECATSTEDLWECGAPRSEIYSEDLPEIQRLQELYDFTYIDVTQSICPGDWCPVVIGDMYVYFDHNHITESYSRSLGPAMKREFEESGALDHIRELESNAR